MFGKIFAQADLPSVEGKHQIGLVVPFVAVVHKKERGEGSDIRHGQRQILAAIFLDGICNTPTFGYRCRPSQEGFSDLASFRSDQVQFPRPTKSRVGTMRQIACLILV